MAISNLQTFEVDPAFPGNSWIGFGFKDLVTGVTTKCFRNVTQTGGYVRALVEFERMTLYDRYDRCDDPRVRFLYGEVGGLAVTEFVPCNGRNETIYGGGKIQLICSNVDRGTFGKVELLPLSEASAWRAQSRGFTSTITCNCAIMQLNVQHYIIGSLILARSLAHPFPPWRRQLVAYQPAIAIGSDNRSQDTVPLPWINSTNLPVALTKALQLNLTSELSKFHANGSYVDIWELPDINNKNYSDPYRCYWPHIGQRYQMQAYESFVSKTSSSQLSFWINDESNGRYVHCNGQAPPGFNLLRTYVNTPCLNDNFNWKLVGPNADTLVVHATYGCKDYWAFAEAKVAINTVCAPILDGTQCKTPQYSFFPIVSVTFFRNYSFLQLPVAPGGYRSIGAQETGLTGPRRKKKRRRRGLLRMLRD
ncbi:MAG: hypothetical protein Q9179_006140 [Wetmoreana sp. 5 TL-2023]